MQLLNIYYLVKADKPYRFRTTEVKNDIPPVDGAQCVRGVKIDDLKADEFTFPIDRYIVGELMKWRNGEVVK